MAHMTAEENFLGHGGPCGEHRTVGPVRAWCYSCQEWCYRSDGCRGCKGADAMIGFTIEHQDVGGTLQTSIYVAGQLILEFLPGTRHTDRADAVAETVLADALRPLLQAAAQANGCQPPRSLDDDAL